ncbi:hypothetical protein [Saccharothrix yanglingensis]|uniref:Uncharacterized protein n=1 Tax=Saccharothrix yanglingensis TaxID=659496 RepID=A0ABU0X7R5_9PSEU|nr:hypothetical protein [Saccharothrix yanglingensis]MDQ2588166.1 hypothetical protein [Saccharothrix yanglingensis]
MHDLDLPSERPLPDDVRGAARLKLHEGMRRRRSPRAPAAVAAAVAVAGIAAVAAFPPAGTAVDPAERRAAVPELPMPDQGSWYRVREGEAPGGAASRCGGAEGWVPIATASKDRVDLVAFTTPAGVVFCELTPRAVTASAPVADPGALAVSFATATGSLAGFTGPDPRKFALGPDAESPRAYTARFGAVWLAPNSYRPAIDRATTDRLTAVREVGDSSELQEHTALVAPAPPATVVDRDGPGGDRTSPEGARLGRCLAAHQPPVADPDAWRPGMDTAAALGESIQLGFYDGLLVTCHADGRSAVQDLTREVEAPSHVGVVGRTVRGTTAYHGFTPETDPESGVEYTASDSLALLAEVLDDRVATVVLSVTGRDEVTAEPVAGSVALPVPGGAAAGVSGTVTTRDAAGAVLETIAFG